MKTFLELGVLGVLALGAFALIGGFTWYLRYALKARNAAATLASQLGWKPLAPGKGPTDTWFGGVAQGRRVAIRLASLRNNRSTDGRRHDTCLRVVMDVVVRQPIGVSALRSRGDRSSLHRFEEAFSTENAARLGPMARQAMVDFVAKGYPTGVHGVTYRSSPGTRNLFLKDRAAVPDDLMHRDVLSDANLILLHDHPYPEISQEAFGKLLYELAQVAYAIELNR